MNAPVVRLSAYGSATIGALVRSVTPRDVVELELVGRRLARAAWSRRAARRSTRPSARTVRVVCLSATCSPGAQRASPTSSRPSPRARGAATGRSVGADDHVAAADVEVVGELDRDRVGRRGGLAAARRSVSTASDRRARAAGQDDHLVARARACRPRPGRRSGARAAPPSSGRITHWTGQPQRAARRGRRRRRPARGASSSGGPSYQARARRARRRCRRAARRSGTRARRRRRAAPASSPNSASISRKRVLVPVDEVHLVHRGDEVADAEQRGRASRGGATAR